jgi:hypothetical protein
MASSLRNVTVDCTDALHLAHLWADVLGWNIYHDDDPEVLGWVWLADPEGNDFCVERGVDERAATTKSRSFHLTEQH